MATAILLLSVATPLLAMITNRKLAADRTEIVELPVKQVTAEWSGRGLTLDARDGQAEGYSVYVEAEEGLTRLRQSGGVAPVIDATRSLPVYRNPGFWGYPLLRAGPPWTPPACPLSNRRILAPPPPRLSRSAQLL